MSRRLIIRPGAEEDLAQARDWYEAQRDGLGGEFLTAVEERFDHIIDFPESYAVEYRGVRPPACIAFPMSSIIESPVRGRKFWRCCTAAAIRGQACVMRGPEWRGPKEPRTK